MLSKEQLEKIANQGPVDIGGAQNPIVTQMAIELLESRAESLSLREQLEAERQRADTLQTERDEFRRRLKLERSILEDTEKQLAELKAWATNRAITDDARENENYTTLKIDYRQRQLRELLKAAKPAED